MDQLSDKLLVESYQKAVSLKLSYDFIELLLEELYRRDLLPLLPNSSLNAFAQLHHN
ncbi:sporulation histidine kinase inhibitor Sda [Bacillus sp. FJAT-45037]|uniref:sporulation histidine kinase inhibitor Sda n=1 Tax=Bacillus sp. FJAT-45037 TaxID=2011007 RepID=UPI000C2312A3|nr:sporulation histidine kinase inhibitor Sda [Bacillus sp. FJAT-45037]